LSLAQDGWLKVGVNASLYGRVDYPANVWGALLDAAVVSATAAAAAASSPPLLSPTDRATLFDDYLTLAESTGSASITTRVGLEALSRLLLAPELAYEPLVVALSHLNTIAALLIPDVPYALGGLPSASPFDDAAANPNAQACYANYTAWAARQLAPALASLGWSAADPGGGETPLRTLLRGSVLSTAAALGEPSVLAQARAYWGALVASGTPIPVDVEGIVLCSIVRNGTAEDWAGVYARYGSAGDAASKRRYLSALSCTRDRALLKALLDIAMDTKAAGGVAVGDKASVVAGVAGNGFGRDLAWFNLAASGPAWAQLMAWFPGGGGFDVSSLVGSLAGPFQSAEYAAAAGALWGPGGSQRATMSGAARDLTAAVESVGRGILWVAKDKAALCAWLGTQG